MARTWRRRLAKIGGYGILVLLVLAALALTFTVGWRPVIGAKTRSLTSRKFAPSPERMRLSRNCYRPEHHFRPGNRNRQVER